MILKTAVLGMGARGVTYSNLMAKYPQRFAFTAVCDCDKERARRGLQYGLEEKDLFYDEEEFFSKRRADLLVISTQDHDHIRHSLRALELGYHILLEKPVSDSEDGLRALAAAQEKYGKKIIVCHVLRYAPAFLRVKKLLEEGTVGRLVTIDSIEQVFYFHFAHSFVRGNWRNRACAAPVILAKCCHDLDLIQWYAASACRDVSSVGELSFFKRENKPEGSAERCTQCAFRDSCAYSAVKGYITEKCFGANALTNERPVTDEIILRALETGPYGRCVFACDNDVADHQLVTMRFENGVSAQLRMMPFTANGGRIMKFYGTRGEIVLDETEKFIDVKVFSKPKQRIPFNELDAGGYAHGGGDAGLIQALYGLLTGEAEGGTTLKNSLESHFMGIAAEKSRLTGGAPVSVGRC